MPWRSLHFRACGAPHRLLTELSLRGRDKGVGHVFDPRAGTRQQFQPFGSAAAPLSPAWNLSSTNCGAVSKALRCTQHPPEWYLKIECGIYRCTHPNCRSVGALTKFAKSCGARKSSSDTFSNTTWRASKLKQLH